MLKRHSQTGPVILRPQFRAIAGEKGQEPAVRLLPGCLVCLDMIRPEDRGHFMLLQGGKLTIRLKQDCLANLDLGHRPRSRPVVECSNGNAQTVCHLPLLEGSQRIDSVHRR